MSFISLILKNPFRKRSSAILAIIGIGIGIATIVALGAVTDGMVSYLRIQYMREVLTLQL